MGGATSDHFGFPLEIGSAAVVELSELAAAAAGGALAEYGGSEDQAEELAAELTLELAKRDEELELERAARELAERLAERRGREVNRLENEVMRLKAELERERRGFRETFSREIAS